MSNHLVGGIVLCSLWLGTERGDARDLILEGWVRITAGIATVQSLIPVEGSVPEQHIEAHVLDMASISRWIVALHISLSPVDHICVGCPILVLQDISVCFMPIPLP